MADISKLGALQTAEPLDLDTYKDAGSGGGFPKAGRYIVRAPESFPTEAFGATQAGYLSAKIDPTIVGPTNEGFVVKFTRISAKPFKRGGTTVSQVGDYLRACGITGKVPADPQEIADTIEQTVNRTYEADLDWRLYIKATGEEIDGMQNFPRDANNNPQPYVERVDQNTGETKRFWANLVVDRFVPATN